MRLPPELGALAERQFRLLWLGRTTSGVGDALIPVALAIAVLQETGSAGDLGIVLAAQTLARVAFVLVGGVWSDRLDRRLVMLVADAISALAQATLALLLFTDAARIEHFAAVAAILGGAQAFFGPASTGLIPRTVSPARLQQANGLISISDSGAWIAGPALSGVLVAAWGPGVAFAVDAATFAASATALAALRVAREGTAEREPFLAEFRAGLAIIKERSWLSAAFATFSMSNVMLAVYFVLAPLVVVRELGGAGALGAIMTAGAVGGLLGGAAALRLRPVHPLRGSFPVMLFASLQLVLLLVAAPVPVLMLGSALAFFAVVFGNALWDTVLQQHVPRHAISRVSSVDWMISLVFMPAGYVAAGPLADGIGLDATLLAAALLGGAANVLVLAVPSVRRLRRLDIEPVEAAGAPAS